MTKSIHEIAEAKPEDLFDEVRRGLDEMEGQWKEWKYDPETDRPYRISAALARIQAENNRRSRMHGYTGPYDRAMRARQRAKAIARQAMGAA